MKELEITCLSPTLLIADLSLTLSRGDRRTLSEAQADQSKDLAFAIRSGALDATWHQRCRVVKDKKALPPTYVPPYVQKIQREVPPPVEEIAAPLTNLQVLRGIVREVVQEVVREEFKQLRQLIADLPAQSVQVVDPSGGDPGTPVQITTRGEEPSKDEAVFIPTISVKKMDLTVSSAASEAGGLEETAAALSLAKKEK